MNLIELNVTGLPPQVPIMLGTQDGTGQVSCSPHLNIPNSFKIGIYLILERIYTSNINIFHSCIVR